MTKSKWVVDLVDELMKNLSGRQGFDVDGLDDEIINEWKSEWYEIVANHVTDMVIKRTERRKRKRGSVIQ